MSRQRRIPVHAVGGKGFIYDLEDVKILREEYHVVGTLTGILPTAPQQNVFMGLPLELMAEDVEWLVHEVNVGFIVDDAAAHWAAIDGVTEEEREMIDQHRSERQLKQMELYKQNAWDKRETAMDALRARGKPVKEITKKDFFASLESTSQSGVSVEISNTTTLASYDAVKMSYDDKVRNDKRVEPVIKRPTAGSFEMYKYLHDRGYFVSPALRFGGQFLAYPGDSLRYHSHYIAIGFEWDAEFNVLDVVGGGRLGTTVKKCWVVGARDPSGDYTCYSIEWAGFG
jgi:tRNA-splicing endonuclease subunit Sen34